MNYVKIVSIIMMGVLSLILAGCSESSNESPKTVSENSESPKKVSENWDDTHWLRTLDEKVGTAVVGNVLSIQNNELLFVGRKENSSGETNVHLSKIDQYGHTLWEQTVRNLSPEYSILSESPDGTLFYGGRWVEGNEEVHSLHLAHFGTKGNVLWQKNYSRQTDTLDFLVPSKNGSVFVSGRTGTYEEGLNANIYVMLIDSNGDILWDKTYDGGGDETVESLVKTIDGGALIAGYTQTNGNQIYLFRVDSSGKKIWERSYGKGIANAIITDKKGGAYVTGYTSPESSNEKEAFLFHIDKDGNILSQHVYGRGENVEAFDLAITIDGHVLLFGFSEINDTKIPYLIKVSKSGDMIWEKKINVKNGGFYDYRHLQFDNGSIALAGETHNKNSDGSRLDKYDGRIEDFDIYLARINSQGDLLWKQEYPGEYNGPDRVTALIKAQDQGVFLAGFNINDRFRDKRKTFLARIDKDGNLKKPVSTDTTNTTSLFSKKIGSEREGEFNAVAHASDGNFWIVGETKELTKYDTGWLQVVDNHGKRLWDKVFSWPGMCPDFRNVTAAKNGEMWVVGDMESCSARGSQGLILKLSNTGNVIWQSELPSLGGDLRLFDVLANKDGSVLVSGYTSKCIRCDPIGYVAKINSKGVKEWDTTHSGPIEAIKRVSKNKVRAAWRNSSAGGGGFVFDDTKQGALTKRRDGATDGGFQSDTIHYNDVAITPNGTSVYVGVDYMESGSKTAIFRLGKKVKKQEFSPSIDGGGLKAVVNMNKRYSIAVGHLNHSNALIVYIDNKTGNLVSKTLGGNNGKYTNANDIIKVDENTALLVGKSDYEAWIATISISGELPDFTDTIVDGRPSGLTSLRRSRSGPSATSLSRPRPSVRSTSSCVSNVYFTFDGPGFESNSQVSMSGPSGVYKDSASGNSYSFYSNNGCVAGRYSFTYSNNATLIGTKNDTRTYSGNFSIDGRKSSCDVIISDGFTTDVHVNCY